MKSLEEFEDLEDVWEAAKADNGGKEISNDAYKRLCAEIFAERGVRHCRDRIVAFLKKCPEQRALRSVVYEKLHLYRVGMRVMEAALNRLYCLGAVYPAPSPSVSRGPKGVVLVWYDPEAQIEESAAPEPPRATVAISPQETEAPKIVLDNPPAVAAQCNPVENEPPKKKRSALVSALTAGE